MATLLSALETQVRRHLLETTAAFWTSAELIDIMNQGIKDLWGSCIDLHQEHWFTNDATNVSMAANTATLTGVPTDVFRVLLIEPRVVTQGTDGNLVQFVSKDYNSRQAIAARSLSAIDANVTGGGVVYYSVTQAGAPVGAPTIYVAPQLTAALLLRLVYVPIQVAVLSSGNNPIPGESDNALVAWTVAYARAKEREDRSPDPNWLAVYGTEKQNVLVRLAPRDESDPDMVEGMFEGFVL
jgi:hypothetical protein